MSDADTWIADFLDGALGADGEKSLHAWLNANSENLRCFTEAVMFDQQIRAAIHADEERRATANFQTTAERPIMRKSRFTWRNFAAAAVILLGIWSTVSLVRDFRGAPLIARVKSVSGSVSWIGNGGELRHALTPGQDLAAGTFNTEGSGGTMQLALTDGTLLTMTGECELVLSDAGQKRIELRHGSISARVVPQPPGKPLIVRTRSAELEVLGTAFAVSSAANATSLDVDSGKVRMIRLADGKSIEVARNQHGMATLDVAAELMVAAPTAPTFKWQQSYEIAPNPLCSGVWMAADGGLSGRFRAVPYVATREEDGIPLTFFGISAVAAAEAISPYVTLAAGSVLRVRYRMNRPVWPAIFLSTSRGICEFGGNFSATLPEPLSPPDDHGWHNAELPLTALEPLNGPDYASWIGTSVRLTLMHTSRDDVELEVAEISIESL